MVVQYRNLKKDEICRALFAQFIRHQEVRDCWRRENGEWVTREDPFIDDWTEEEYKELVRLLKRTIARGGLVIGAFCDNILKGFASVEAGIFCPEQGYLDLSSIHVSKDMRGKGIGRALFGAAQQWAKDHGARKLYISAHSAVESQAFYKAMGCVEAKVYHQGHVEAEPYDCQLECDLEVTDQNEFYGTFEKLLQKAEELVTSEPSIQQAIVALTSGGKIFCCINHDIIAGNHADEVDFVNMLSENNDTELRYSVCMWNDFTLDIPSQHLRNLLVELNPLNRKAQFLLRSGEKIKIRALGDMHGI